MSSDWYILNEDHTFSKVSNMHEHYEWEKNHGFNGLKEDRRTVDRYESKSLVVSTVFLGLDHSFGEGPPILFETLVSGGDLEGEMDRYYTWEEAIKGHNNMMKLCGIEIKKTKKKEINDTIENRFDILDL